jgi:hypothetical protein
VDGQHAAVQVARSARQPPQLGGAQSESSQGLLGSHPSSAGLRASRADSYLWALLQAKLVGLTSLQSRSATNLKVVNILQGQLQAEVEPLGVLRPKLERAYAVARNDISEEEKWASAWLSRSLDLMRARLLKDIVEQLSILTALRANPEPAPSSRSAASQTCVR